MDAPPILTYEFDLTHQFITLQEGFVYHHAEPHYLMLVKWIHETPSTIPANATHRLRIGAIVLNDKREVFSISFMYICLSRSIIRI